MPEIRKQDLPVVEGVPSSVPRLLSPRAYNLILAGLLFASFLVMGLSAAWVTSPSFYRTFGQSMDIIVLISFVVTVASIFIMSSGKKHQRVVRSAVGFTLFTLSFGLTLGAATASYDVVTVSNALIATAVIVAVFGALGLAFPAFFAKVYRVCLAAFIAVFVAELIFILMGIDQGAFDWAVLVLFCGFVGYDLYQAASDTPTLPNALWHAADIFIDIANILLGVLNLMDRD